MFYIKFVKKIKNILFPFYKDRDLKFIFKKLQENSDKKLKSAMFVGGCVRNYLLNENVDDIDIATSLTTNEIKNKFKNTKYKILDTGIKHGTVTLISEKFKLEITTLRKDIKTDGRHAEIVYTDDWKEDSERRDLTINAIYMDINGKIYDFQNGVQDLKKNVVKFIGDPNERIKEDYLRIIRFLRFAIQYDSTTDIDTINALKLNLDGIKNLSKERIFDELFKVLNLKNFDNILKHKNKKDIFLLIFPELKNIDKIKKLKYFQSSNYILNSTQVLGILLSSSYNDYEYFFYKYKTSNKLNKNLELLFKLYNKSKSNKNFFKQDLIKNVYYNGSNTVKDLVILHFFDNSKMSFSDFNKMVTKIEKVKIPKFIYDGHYLKKKGIKEGATIGKTIKLIENEWINNKFKISNNRVEEIIKNQNN
tara:strand:- start:2757 stop:4016 length:1260 start_codon:yes stop_codon:yes gene_type:complete